MGRQPLFGAAEKSSIVEYRALARYECNGGCMSAMEVDGSSSDSTCYYRAKVNSTNTFVSSSVYNPFYSAFLFFEN